MSIANEVDIANKVRREKEIKIIKNKIKKLENKLGRPGVDNKAVSIKIVDLKYKLAKEYGVDVE